MGRGEIIRTVANRLAREEPLRSAIEGTMDVRSGRYTFNEMKIELVYSIIDSYEHEIIKQLKKTGRVNITGLYTLEVKEYPARTTYNFEQGKKVEYPSSKIVKCRASQNLKDIIQGRKEYDDELWWRENKIL